MRLRVALVLSTLAVAAIAAPAPAHAAIARDSTLPGERKPDFSAVDAAVLRGIRRGVYPGAVVVIGTHSVCP